MFQILADNNHNINNDNSKNINLLAANERRPLQANKTTPPLQAKATPIILKKIINDKAKIIPLKPLSFLGLIRHFPPTLNE